jgi:transposase InsO family protein
MHAEKSNFTVSRMARLLEVSRSGFYAWLQREPSKRALRTERVEAKIAWFHGASDEVSGSPRILADLREDGETISRKTVAKAMRRLGLRGICPRRWKTTTIVDHADAYPADAAKRVWDTGVLNAVWVGDISYLRTWEGWLYLATVIDAHSRRVIGWAIGDHMRTDLVEDALKMAITLRGELPAQVVFHTDRGTQGGFNWSSQHLDHGGVRWDVARRRDRILLRGGGGNGRRIGRCDRRCVHRAGRSPLERCSESSGG